jgi:UMF1 family MFS transporter
MTGGDDGNGPAVRGGPRNDRRSLFGWAMYDWANSAYFTTVAAALLPAYFERSVVPAEGFELFGRVLGGEALWGYLISYGTFVIFLISPVLGAVADFSSAKKKLLKVFAYGGALCTTMFVFVGTGDVLITMGLFFLTQVGFVSANVFYDGFLPDLTTPDTIDRVSARGYAFGYIGGGIYFAIALLLVTFNEPLGLDKGMAVRVALAGAGLWWLGFTVFALRRFEETGEPSPMPEQLVGVPRPVAYARIGFGRILATLRRLVGFPQLLLFLVAYMIYVDGIQTVLNMSSVYASGTLGLESTEIMATFLIVQFVAFGGAWFFGRVAGRISARPTILICLAGFALITVAAYFLPERVPAGFMALGACVGFVQGGAQSLSRSLYGSMIPEEASAEFFGFYSVLSKFAAIWGPLIFAMMVTRTGSGRPAILALMAFFVVGGILLAMVDVEEARASKARWSFEGSRVDTG